LSHKYDSILKSRASFYKNKNKMEIDVLVEINNYLVKLVVDLACILKCFVLLQFPNGQIISLVCKVIGCTTQVKTKYFLQRGRCERSDFR
jgi:hypothetical protein